MINEVWIENVDCKCCMYVCHWCRKVKKNWVTAVKGGLNLPYLKIQGVFFIKFCLYVHIHSHWLTSYIDDDGSFWCLVWKSPQKFRDVGTLEKCEVTWLLSAFFK